LFYSVFCVAQYFSFYWAILGNAPSPEATLALLRTIDGSEEKAAEDGTAVAYCFAKMDEEKERVYRRMLRTSDGMMFTRSRPSPADTRR
jgi:hypothetical protein